MNNEDLIRYIAESLEDDDLSEFEDRSTYGNMDISDVLNSGQMINKLRFKLPSARDLKFGNGEVESYGEIKFLYEGDGVWQAAIIEEMEDEDIVSAVDNKYGITLPPGVQAEFGVEKRPESFEIFVLEAGINYSDYKSAAEDYYSDR